MHIRNRVFSDLPCLAKSSQTLTHVFRGAVGVGVCLGLGLELDWQLILLTIPDARIFGTRQIHMERLGLAPGSAHLERYPYRGSVYSYDNISACELR